VGFAPPWRADPPAQPASPAANARAAYQSQQDAKAADDARKSYNGGIKLAKIALQAHTTLAEYFPRSGEMKTRINDVSYEDVLRTEHKMWKEALPLFQRSLEKLGSARGGLADDIRGRAEANMRNIESYLKEWKDLKFKLEFQGVKRGEMQKLYRDYVESKRSDAFKHEIAKPEGPVATT
jgi:hypothetical protein